MYYQQEDITDIQLRKPKSLAVKSRLENDQDEMSGEAMITFSLNEDTLTKDIELTLTSWYRKRYKTFLLHYGSSTPEILVEGKKVDYFLDMGVGGSGFTYKQVLEDFFGNIEENHGTIIQCEVIFL